MDKNRVWAEVDLDAIKNNMEAMHENLKPGTKMMAVLKADGYGHGAVEIAKMLEDVSYVFGYAAATVDEAMDLRAADIKKPILILGYTFEDTYEDMILNDIRPTFFTYQDAKKYADVAEKLQKVAPIHLAIDTGMGRIGFQMNRDSVEEIKRISELASIRLEGVFTHFARADEMDKTATREQYELFMQMIHELENNGVTFELHHCANSAAILEFPDANLEMVRAGITMYGLWPSEEMDHSFPLEPALSLYSHVVHIKTVEAGTTVSYGGTFVAEETMRIATIPVGYADGYARSLSNCGYVLIRGHKAPILGRVCMDQFMVDVSGIPEASVLDKVTLIGSDGDHKITLDKLGELSHRFNYEFVCDLGIRIPRVYFKDGKIVAEKDYIG